MPGATVEELKAAWDCLPDTAWFAGFFESELSEVAVAKRHREALWKQLVEAAVELERAEVALGDRIRRTMAGNWTPEQIAAAMESARDGKEGA